MIPVLLIRHGATVWNVEGRMQGHTDISLSAEGRSEVSGWSLPQEVHDYDWFVSPLLRTKQTADLLNISNPKAEPRLMEMSWGDWEGHTRAALRKRHGASMAKNEARGIDFRPPGGESVRELRARFKDWLSEIAIQGRPTGAVTHKGVITIALALATGWDLTSKRPHRLGWSNAHLFYLHTNCSLEIQQLNIALAPNEQV